MQKEDKMAENNQSGKWDKYAVNDGQQNKWDKYLTEDVKKKRTYTLRIFGYTITISR